MADAKRGKSPRSTYQSPLRTRQAAQTRRAVLDAAIEVFSERGWSGATIAAVAALAGVAVETVYAVFGSKSALFLSALDVAIIGDDEEAPLVARDDFAALAAGTRKHRLESGMRIVANSYTRSLPMLRALREAASSEESALEWFEKYEEDRRAVMATGLELILGHEAAPMTLDFVSTIASPEVFTKLTEERHWSVDEYVAWVARSVALALKEWEPS